MNNFIYATGLVAFLISSSSAFGSGCGWSTVYEKGEAISSYPVSGVFKCKFTSGNDYGYCTFTPEGSVDHRFSSFGTYAACTPPQDVVTTMTVNSYDSMEWDRCDDEPPPPFESNGTIEEFQNCGNVFQRFTRK